MKEGQHVEYTDDEEEVKDPLEFRKILKTQNSSIVKLQKLRDSKVFLYID